MGHSAERDERPVALCCCGTPLVGTFERPGYEWYCVGCKGWFGWLHARKGDGPNPTAELEARAAEAKEQYDAERRARVTPPAEPGADRAGGEQ